MITPNDLKVLFDEETIATRIAELAQQIDNDYSGKDVRMFCVLNGALYFFTALTQRITKATVITDTIQTSSYGNNFQSSGHVDIFTHPSSNITGEDIIIVEDIIDSGRTMEELITHFAALSPRSIKICVLLNKPCRRMVKNIRIDYCGFEIDDKFIVGYGLDYESKYRNLPYIGYVPCSQ